MIQVHPLKPDVRLEAAAAASLEPEVAAAVDRIWTHEMAARGAGLFDGPIFSLAGQAPDRLVLQPATYRRLIASRRDPALARRIGLRPLGVTGLLLCPDGVVLGRRGAKVHVEPGRWEPAPAGALDELDWGAVVRRELREELGLEPEAVSPPSAVALVEDHESGVCDILCRLRTDLAAADIRAAWRRIGTDEYDELAVVAPGALPGFLAGNAASLLPALAPMLAAAGLMRESGPGPGDLPVR
jgi:8-oxo-dGTP pyrophosphatase MutT (NUDIX family)